MLYDMRQKKKKQKKKKKKWQDKLCISMEKMKWNKYVENKTGIL